MRAGLFGIYYSVYTLLFEWDENKNRANRAKHGIDFNFARNAFDDPLAIIRQDRDVEGEQRYQLIDAIFERIILVAYAVHVKSPNKAAEKEVIRLISARKATPGERNLYEENEAN